MLVIFLIITVYDLHVSIQVLSLNFADRVFGLISNETETMQLGIICIVLGIVIYPHKLQFVRFYPPNNHKNPLK